MGFWVDVKNCLKDQRRYNPEKFKTKSSTPIDSKVGKKIDLTYEQIIAETNPKKNGLNIKGKSKDPISTSEKHHQLIS